MQKRELLQPVEQRGRPQPRFPSLTPSFHRPVMGNAATAKKGSEMESGESRAGSWDPQGGPGRGTELPSGSVP